MNSGAKHPVQGRESAAPGRGTPRPSTDAAVAKSTPAAPRILVVEDQEDVRRLVATALEIEGYEVHEAANAHEGLKRLRQRRYHLVLTDYAMPGGTGTWMLREADRLGLMDGAAAMIVTAHPDVRELANITVIHKPLDLDDFLDQVRSVLPPWRSSSNTVDSEVIELVLYISSTSPASTRARQNLAELLSRFEQGRIRYTIVDLATDPMAGDADRIAFTPTLVKRSPGPRTWILGNLQNVSILADILQASGIGAAR
jgi:two-component system response regulator GlrR